MTDKVSVDALTLATLKREASVNAVPLSRRLLRAVSYFGVGALFHAWQLGPVFDPNSLWSWGYVIAWPVMLLFGVILPVIGWLFYIAFLIMLLAASTAFTGWVCFRLYLTWIGRGQ